MIIINGVTYSGNNLSISNNKVYIDGKEATVSDSKEINITVNANLNILDVDNANNIKIIGNVGSVTTKSGDVEISGDVSGNIITTSGDVDCSNVSGSIHTKSGDIKNKK